MQLPQIVLASTSPYRHELLSRLGLPFETAEPGIDETIQPGESPENAALRLSEAKARAVADRFPSALVIGSDQVAYCGSELFGKPGSHDKAVEQLRALRGRTIRFFTGLCLLNAQTGRSHVAGVGTDVTFRQLSEQEIEEYLCKERPYNCAGSAKSEGLGIALVSRMVGEDPNALIGLPLIALCDMLRLEGINPLASS
ncbi:Maf family protein [Propionivibrio soli]|uniref:Maf family protein n=1 Tax=Propionivibrio soli TaxID=2976531 RepID=UPI0021E71207|nr:Maf family nucleotide pyrophosphatase [Propionivibrio soli]